MGDNQEANNATITTDDGAPSAKKAKLDVPGSNSQLRPNTDGVGSRNSAQDGRRKGTLTLMIDDWATFKHSTQKLYSEPLSLAGVEWKAEVFVRNPLVPKWIVVSLRASNPTSQALWVRKAEFVLRWPRRPQGEYAPRSALFFPDVPSGGWSETNTLEHVERTGVEDNVLKLTLDITIFHCYITEGTLGIQSRFLDVTIIVGKSRVYSNKGFLPANADFFEGMFYGDFADRNKDEVTLNGVRSSDFRIFICSIAPGAPPIMSQQVVTLLRMADRFQAHKLAERCTEFLLKEQPANIPFVQQLEIADELNMGCFRDLLIDYASAEMLAEAAAEENEEKFSKQTWMKLFLKYKQLKPT